MAYFILDLIKSHLEMVPTDNSIDPVLTNYGAGGDVWVDVFIGHTTPLTTSIPTAYRQASSLYAAAAYKKDRLKDDAGAEGLEKRAKELLELYHKSLGRITVFG